MIEAFEKAGLNGVAAGAGTLCIFGTGAKVFMPYFGSNVNLGALAFGVGAVGSLVGDLAHKFIKDDVDISEKWKDRTSLLTGMAINGALFTGLLCLYDREVCKDFGYGMGFLVGAGSEFLGSASYNYLKSNMYM